VDEPLTQVDGAVQVENVTVEVGKAPHGPAPCSDDAIAPASAVTPAGAVSPQASALSLYPRVHEALYKLALVDQEQDHQGSGHQDGAGHEQRPVGAAFLLHK